MSQIKYGKTSSSLLLQKKSFFEENSLHVKKQNKIAKIYVKQPKRINCKNCANKLNKDIDFEKNGIGYTICNKCSHLNGIYEDTDLFCDLVYSSELSAQYMDNYNSKTIDDFNYRTTSIYIPKAEFLISSLIENHIEPSKLKYLDFGAGAGYFVSALNKVGIKNVKGYEVSKSLVGLGTSIIGENKLPHHSINDGIEIINKTNDDVISLIGVLEHLQNPRDILKAINKNKKIRYIFMSVPTFSLSVFLEILKPAIYNRQLCVEHTHLYTPDSISHLCDEFKLKSISEWWFGTDIVDLFRNVSVSLEKIKSSKKLKDNWTSNFSKVIDSMQLELDKKHFCSEVHILMEKIN